MKSKGFTLVELLVVISIIAILSMVAIANLNSLNTYSRGTAKEEIIQAIRSARAEAIARNDYVDFALTNAANHAYAIRQLSLSGTSYSVDTGGVIRSISVGSEKSRERIVLTFQNLKTTADGYSGIVFNSKGQVDNVTNTANAITIQISISGVTQTESVNIVRGTGYIY